MCNHRLSWLKYTINNSTSDRSIDRQIVQQKESIRFHRPSAIYDWPRALNKGLLDRWAGCVLCSRTSRLIVHGCHKTLLFGFPSSRSYHLLRSARGDSNSVPLPASAIHGVREWVKEEDLIRSLRRGTLRMAPLSIRTESIISSVEPSWPIPTQRPERLKFGTDKIKTYCVLFEEASVVCISLFSINTHVILSENIFFLSCSGSNAIGTECLRFVSD